MIKKILKLANQFGWDRIGGLILVLCFFATIGGSAFFQYVLKQPPCFLCYVQRVPYWVAGVLGALSLMRRFSLKSRRKLLIAAAVILFCNIFISAYAVGVEQQWWAGPSVCMVNEAAITAEDINALLSGSNVKQVVPCNKVRWTFLGLPYLTLAFFNVFICLGVTIMLSFLISYKKAWRKNERRAVK